ncbi:MAG TPA: methionyl-tRNA formyltransferase [Gammaproteobacteria bacterium]
MRLVFAGTPDFAVPALDALIAAGHEIVAVYTQPDRPAGRGRKLAPSPVKQRALEHGIPVEQPESLKNPEGRTALAAYHPDVMIVVAYGLLLPQAVLDIPAHGCLNIHASLLPRWRGAAPIQRAIAAGDTETGVGIMRMEKGLDTGPVLLERRIPIDAAETGGSLHDKLAALGAEAIVEALANLTTLDARPQDDSKATYAYKLTKQEAALDWSKSAIELARQVRAFDPWPVAFTIFNHETLRIWSAEALPLSAKKFTPGEIASATVDGIDLATGEGLLRITRLQPPGKRPMNVAEFLNGHAVAVGQRLGR